MILLVFYLRRQCMETNDARTEAIRTLAIIYLVCFIVSAILQIIIGVVMAVVYDLKFYLYSSLVYVAFYVLICSRIYCLLQQYYTIEKLN